MRRGQVVLDRFELLDPLPAPRGQVRWSARDQATGDAVEIVAPTAQVALRPGASEHFARAQVRQIVALALLPAGVQGREGGRPMASRAAVDALDPGLRLSPEQAMAWAAWLGPAARAAESALGGQLSTADLVLDGAGIVRLAPAGVAPPRQSVHPLHHLAPELRSGGPAVPGSALYGLGVTLFQAVTGTLPVPAASAADLAAAGPPRRAREIQPELPEAIDELLAGLLDSDPARRLAALASLPASEAVTAPPGAVLVARPSAASGVVTTRQGGATPTARVDRPRQPWAVIVDTDQLTDAARARASALVDLPEAAVAGVAAAGLPIPLQGAATQAEAQALAEALSAQGLPARAARDGAASGPAAAAAAAGLGAATTAGLAALALVMGAVLGPLALPLAVGLMLLTVALVLLTGRQVTEAGRRVALADARRRLVSPRATEPTPFDEARAELRAARRRILDGNLPAPVRVDLEGAAQEIAAELSTLERSDIAPADVVASVGELRALIAELAQTANHPVDARPTRPLEDRVRDSTKAARAAASELGRKS